MKTEQPDPAQPLKFKLARKEVLVEIDDKPYKLVELTGQQRDAYLTFNAGKMRFDAAGKPVGFRDFNGLQTNLLAQTLQDPDGKLVREDVLKSWPSSVVEDLYAASQKLSGIGLTAEAKEKAATEAKND